MSKQLFTKKQQEQLRQNPHVKRVSEKAITYTDAFKQLFIHENEQGKLPSQIFEEAGFDAEMLGMTRIYKASSRWRAAYKDNGVAGLEDTRKYSSGRPLERELSIEEKYARFICLLVDRAFLIVHSPLVLISSSPQEILLSTRQKFQLIHHIIEKYQLKRLTSYLCKLTGVSRSGYYGYFTEEAVRNRIKREEADLELKAIILKAYQFRHRNKGARQIKMTLGQSMSRRGNCWDNAPQESFFGHLKDETRMSECETLDEVKQEIKAYMIYYNYYRGQWNLKKLPPAKYRQQLEQVA